MINLTTSINYILSVGSVDGVCTSAAVLRTIAPDADIQFCQAFTIDKIDVTKWRAGRKVLLVDLAVNNRDEAMTMEFLRRVKAAGHQIIGVLDEYNAEDWRKAFAAAELSFDELAIKPVSQNDGDIKSSGALLLSLLGNEADEQTRELCEAADAGDRMDFSTYFGSVVNQAVKSKIADDSRRVYLAKRLAKDGDYSNTVDGWIDDTIDGWIAEYEAILATHKEIVEARQYLGDGITRVNTAGKVVDMTTLMKTVYELGYDIVVTEGEMFDKEVGAKTRQVSFGRRPGFSLDVLATIKAAGIECSGFASKVNIKPENEKAALAAIQDALTTVQKV